MPKPYRIAVAAALLLAGAAAAVANDVPPNFPNPANVRVEADVLTWDAVADAGGYNVYFDAGTSPDGADTPLTYIATVKGATALALEASGTYSVVSFNADASLFSNQFSPGVRVVYRGGLDFASPVQLLSITCGNVQAGEACTASCPGASTGGFSFLATGGACATSGTVEADASADPASYTCTVPTFADEVRAQVYCLDTGRLAR